MEINITEFFKKVAPCELSASVAELGDSAGAITWRNSCTASVETCLLDTDEKRESFRKFVSASGGWTWDEINAWSDVELNALFLQWIAGDMREMGIDEDGSETTDAQWREIEADQADGRIPSNIYRGDDGQVYFYAGC